jgi:ABC-type polysaccharide transport system, permease component
MEKAIKKKKTRSIFAFTYSERTFILMLIPGVIFLIVFNYVPMFGVVMAFQNYLPSLGILGSKWVGLANFQYLFQIPDIAKIFSNTLIIACTNIVLGLIIPIIFALLLNEVKNAAFKRSIQTIIYLPFFLSWVVLGIIFQQMFSLNGMINNLTVALFGKQIMFYSSNVWFRPILILTAQWKGFGWGTIIYLAAITSIDLSQYEAATIDGATRFRKMWHITLPGMSSTIILMAVLALGNVLNAGFDQIFNMYNPLVYDTADIIDTYVYRMGLVQMQFSMSSAVGLLKSVISFIMIAVSYVLARKYADYRIF